MAFTTKKSLLARVRAGDEVSWREFYDTYRPLIFLCGKDCGLNYFENEELVQQVMCEIFKKDILAKYDIDNVPKDVMFKYDPSRGRFRYFLKAIIRNHARKIYHARREQVSIEEVPEPASEEMFDAVWDEDWQTHLLTQALVELRGRVQAETYSAFEMYALHGHPVKEVAEFLNLSENSVYVAKNRCITLLKSIIGNLEKR